MARALVDAPWGLVVVRRRFLGLPRTPPVRPDAGLAMVVAVAAGKVS